MSKNSIAAADLFLELANFWQPPDEEFWQELSDGLFDREIAELAKHAGYAPQLQSLGAFADCLPPLASLQSFFIRCFIGIGQKSAIPVESIYKKWTEDQTTRLPIAGSTGSLMGDPALHAQYLLTHYGLTIPPDYRMMPDHLSLLLELAAFLLRNRTDEEARLFLEQHLDWIGKFEEALIDLEPENAADHGAQRFYQLALQTIKQTVDCQLMKYFLVQ